MALGYAEKLSYREDIGKVGMPELFDSRATLQYKIEELAKLIQESHHLVAFTGAGISTSCGIPDFRGPKGVWTLQHEGKPLPKADLPFHQARPGITHMALVALQRLGILKFIISQNVDGLHLKSGIPRSCLAELHGSSFREVCSSCKKEYVRDFEVETIGLKDTGRRCSEPGCGGKLKDTVLDWEDALPSEELIPAEKHCKEADVVLCLGTSLQITPACNLPLRAVRAGGKMVIINLQATPKDKKAALVIHARVDEVIAGVMEKLCVSIPAFVRVDRVMISWFFTAKAKKHTARWTLRVSSSHGRKAPLPFVDSVEVSFPDRPDLKSAVLKEQPFILRRTTVKLKDFDVLVKLQFGDGCMCTSVGIRHPLKFGGLSERTVAGKDEENQVESLTSEVAENGGPMEKTSAGSDKDDMVETLTNEVGKDGGIVEDMESKNKEDLVDLLRSQAAKDGEVGCVLPVETSSEDAYGGLVTEYAIVTCILRHGVPLKSDAIKVETDGPKRCNDQVEDVKESTSKKTKTSRQKG